MFDPEDPEKYFIRRPQWRSFLAGLPKDSKWVGAQYTPAKGTNNKDPWAMHSLPASTPVVALRFPGKGLDLRVVSDACYTWEAIIEMCKTAEIVTPSRPKPLREMDF